jgi:hypothetical protein
MPREHLSEHDRRMWEAEVLSDITQVQYVHPGGSTVDHVPPVDASVRYLAVPPVLGTNGPRRASSNVIVRPTSITMLRQNNPYFLAFDGASETRLSAHIRPDMIYTLPISPAVNTLSFTAAVGTDPLIANWNHGA